MNRESARKEDIEEIQAPEAARWDGAKALGNDDHWGCWIKQLEEQVAKENHRHLSDAGVFVAWLLMSSEYIAQRLRFSYFANDSFSDQMVFDLPYAKLEERAASVMPTDVLDALRFVLTARHIIVHKGFPNLQAAPAERSLPAGFPDIRQVLEDIREPRNFQRIRAKCDMVHQWITENTPPVRFGISPPAAAAARAGGRQRRKGR